MNALFSLLTIFVVIQVSASASIPNSKGQSDEAIQVLMEIVENEKDLVEDVLEHMPPAPAYDVFRRPLQKYLELYNYKDETFLCVVKIQALMEAFNDIIATYEAPGSRAEAKAMLNIFHQFGLPNHIEHVIEKLEEIKEVDKSKFLDKC